MASTRLIASTAMVLMLSAAAVSAAEPKPRAKPKPQAPSFCAISKKSAQDADEAGHLREAKELYGKCAVTVCGALEKKCAAEAARLEVEIPQISPVVTDEKGAPLVDVIVRIDGEIAAQRLDGRPLRVNPGVHEFTITSLKPDEVPLAKRRVMIVQGQRGAVSFPLRDEEEPTKPAPEPARVASVAAPAPERQREAPPAPERKAGGSAVPYVLGSVGLLAIGSGVLLTYWGNKDNDQLAQCSPTCSPSSVTHIRRLYIAADVSFGVGAVGLAVATILFATRRSEKPAARMGYKFDVQPSAAGAVTTLSGSF